MYSVKYSFGNGVFAEQREDGRWYIHTGNEVWNGSCFVSPRNVEHCPGPRLTVFKPKTFCDADAAQEEYVNHVHPVITRCRGKELAEAIVRDAAVRSKSHPFCGEAKEKFDNWLMEVRDSINVYFTPRTNCPSKGE